MNKYRIIFILLCVGVYYAYREMQKTYKKIPNQVASSSSSSSSSSNTTTPAQTLADEKKQRSKNQTSENIYFIIVDRFVDADSSNNKLVDLYNPLAFHGGDLKGITSQLSYLSDLGITAIRLSSVQLLNNKPSEFKDPTSGDIIQRYPFSGSSQIALTAIDPAFGKLDELQSLINEAHRQNIKVYLNFPISDLDDQSQLNEQYFDLKAPLCGTNLSMQDILNCHFPNRKRLNFSNAEIRKQIISEVLDFAQATKLDGFYLIGSRTLPENFIQEFDDSIITRPALANFNLIYDWGAKFQPHIFKRFEQDYFGKYIMPESYNLITSLLLQKSEMETFQATYQNLFNLKQNRHHIENLTGATVQSLAVIYKNNLNLMLSHVALWGFLNDSLMFNYGEEKGIENFDIPYYYTNMPWQDKSLKPNASTPINQTLFGVFKRLLNARKLDPALTQATVEKVYGMDGLHVWAKTFQGQLVAYLVLNLSEEEKAIFFKHPSPVRKTNGVDLLSGAAVESLNEGVTFTPDQKGAQLIVF